MKRLLPLCLALLFLVSAPSLTAQVCCDQPPDASVLKAFTSYDSILASRIPVVRLPEEYRQRMLPPMVDNSALPYFPGIYAQYLFFSCQQYSGVAYTYTYEVNRMRNVPANVAENRYPAHYTWNFMNWGGQFIGVSFLHTFHALMQQGQMNQGQYGWDTVMRYVGWPTGYEKYESAFPNRIRSVKAIPVDSEEGILTLKHYVNDHLDGSATGGVACFTAAGPTNASIIPNGLPEAGKTIVINWQPWATHGMTIVGYNDSVRYDLNADGQCTNHLDINEDGVVDVKDWEIGAFKFANSYGAWWADGGYAYVLYHAMASPFESGGVWNQCVYIVEPETEYTPLMGMEFSMKYNRRNQLRIQAGVNPDTTADVPSALMEFPFFNYQGGPHVMQGFDTTAGQEEIEIGMDVTPLLSYVTPGQPARFFFVLQEDDPWFLGAGTVHEAAFHDYSSGGLVHLSRESETAVVHNGTTYLSAVCTPSFTPVQITTEALPPLTGGQPWSAQLTSTGGSEPLTWSLVEKCRKYTIEDGFQGVTDQPLYEQSDEILFAPVPLPFSFPFYGKSYDTVFMNSRGLLQFTEDQLPYPYLIEENDMLRNEPSIFPGFSGNHRIFGPDGDGMWVRIEPSRVTFRWKVSVYGFETATSSTYELAIFPDGSFEFHYGPGENTGTTDAAVYGYSAGDDVNYEIVPVNNIPDLEGHSVRYVPNPSPDGLTLSGSGLLSLNEASAQEIRDIRVRVTDARLLFAEKEFQLSSGLLAAPMLSTPSGLVTFGTPQPVDLEIKNTGGTELNELQFVVTCDDPRVLFTDSTETAASLGTGQILLLPQAFTFSLTEPVSDKTLLFFTLTAASGTQSWNYPFIFTAGAPDLSLTAVHLYDGHNGLLDPGETADLKFGFANLGSLDANSVLIAGAVQDTSITILPPESFDIEQFRPGSVEQFSFRLRASKQIPPGTTKQVTLIVTSEDGPEQQFPIDLQIGSKPVAIVSLTSNTSSVTAMKTALDSLGVPYDHYTWVATEALDYPLIFLILGQYTGSHLLTESESDFFSNYLADGGNLYMESHKSWTNEELGLLPMMRLKTEPAPVYYFEEVTGVAATSFEGLDFLYSSPAVLANFAMIPIDPGFPVMVNQDTPPMAIQIAYDGEDYRTIASLTEFGKMEDGTPPSVKKELMERYLDFFRVQYKNPFPFFHADSTTICRFHPVQFTDDSFENIISWAWDFPGGQPSASTEQNPTVIYPDAGAYDVRLTVSDGTLSHSLTRKNFINVQVCAGTGENAVLDGLSVFPNPANDQVRLRFAEPVTGPVQVSVFDITGRIRLSASGLPGNGNTLLTVRLNGIPAGLYLLRISAGEEVVTRKILVEK